MKSDFLQLMLAKLASARTSTHSQFLVDMGGALGVATVLVPLLQVALVLLQHACVLVQAAEGLAEGCGEEHDAWPLHTLTLHKAAQLIPVKRAS